MKRYAAVLLAAGAGRRFGGAKLLADFDGRSLLWASLSRLAAHPVDPIVVVTGADAEAVAAQANLCAGAAGFADRLRVIHADSAAEGMGASLRAGVASLRGVDDVFTGAGVLVALADMPCVPSSLFPDLCSALEAGAEAAAPIWRGRRGHPVLFGPTLVPALARTAGDEGARELLAELGDRLARVPAASDGVLLDVDRPEDLERLRGLVRLRGDAR